MYVDKFGFPTSKGAITQTIWLADLNCKERAEISKKVTSNLKGIKALRACHKYLKENHVNFHIENGILTGELVNRKDISLLE